MTIWKLDEPTAGLDVGARERMLDILREYMEEERRKEVETDLEAAIQKGRRCGMKEEEIRSLFELIMEDE